MKRDEFHTLSATILRAASSSPILIVGALAWTFVLVPRDLQAVIIANGDGTENTTAPDDDPGWSNVGQYGDFTAVYLGSRWAVAADHVDFAPTLVLNGIPYDVKRGSEITLTNPAGWTNQDGIELTSATDVRLFRLAQDPALPSLTISVEKPELLEEIVMIGRGRDRTAEQTTWNLQPLEGQTFVWTETEEPPFDAVGYKIETTQTMRWGTNTIVANDSIASWEDQDVIAMVTQFNDDPLLATPFESQATHGDSGGGAFYRIDGQWELAGIMIGAGNYLRGAPPETVVFNSNFTVIADLSVYREQIQQFMTSLQAGDANQDMQFDQFDIIAVLAAGKYLTGQPATWGEGDWNAAPGEAAGDPPAGDGVFDQFDIIAALAPAHYLTGPYAAGDVETQKIDPGTSVVYHAKSGELVLDLPVDVELTSINIDSLAGIFTADAAEHLGRSLDIDTDTTIFKATFGSSFGSLSFGNVARPGLSDEFVVADLAITGSLPDGGKLDNVQIVFVTIAEPSTIVLLCLSLVCLGICLPARRWSSSQHTNVGFPRHRRRPDHGGR